MFQLYLRSPFIVLDRYVFNECWLPFSSGCGIVTGVWLGADQVREAFALLGNANVDFSIAVSIIILSIPAILLATIPVGVLWACFLVFNRLSSDSELVAMRAGGISLLRIAFPGLLFGLVMSLVCFTIGEYIVPWTEPSLQRIQFAAAYNIPFSPGIDDFSFFERSGGKHIGQGPLKRIFHVRRFDPEKKLFIKVTILDYTREDLEQIYVANAGRWNPEKNGWELNNGITYFVPNDRRDKSHTASFEHILIPAGKSVDDLMQKLSKVKSLSIFELAKLLQDHQSQDIQTEFLHKLKMKFHQKIAYPLSCIALALVGIPLGIMGRRTRTNWGYIQTGILVFVYYASQSAFNSLGDNGKLDAFIASWSPNLILGSIGFIILWHKSRFTST
ncbi:MAG: LptF/LptG family permease [Candidatus Caenarcaniphilales bacterium]|nr:LptF/LptG family permease [Candidatus Caenarcaniphilales bacterium]